jgi:hypothetical protein
MADVRRPRGDVRSVEVAFGQRCRFTALKRHVSGLTGTPPTRSRPRRFHGHVLRVSRCHVASGPRRQRLGGILARRPRRTSALSAVTCRHKSSQTAENAHLSTGFVETHTNSPSQPPRGTTGLGLTGGFPALASQLSGFQLRRVQQGLDPDDWKPMQMVGPDVREIRVTSTVHIECSMWRRGGRRSTFCTRLRRRRGRGALRI